MLGIIRSYTLSPLLLNNVSKDEKNTSSWVLTPYFAFYFFTYLVNTCVWPLLLMERVCINTYHIDDRLVFSLNITSSVSCIDRFLTHPTQTVTTADKVSVINNDTINFMVIVSITGAVISLLSFFLVWKPTLNNCKSFGVFLPPVCILLQCILFSYAITIKDSKTFKYVILAGVLLPCFHCNFQGMFLLFYRLTVNTDQKTFKHKREISNTQLGLNHVVMFIGMGLGGLMLAICFDMSYSLVLILQFTLGCMTMMYAVLILPVDCDCLVGEENNEKPEEVSDSLSDSSSSEEDRLLGNSARKLQDGGMLSRQGNLSSEAPMIFSETSYKKEVVTIIELSILTIAVVGDITLSGPYLLESPYKFSLKEYGYCIAVQAFIKAAGVFFMKTVLYITGFKPGTLIAISALNYVAYYIILAIAPSKGFIFVAMVINIFGGLAIPTILSFIKLNFTDTSDMVLEVSTISSLITNVGFSSIQNLVYIKTRSIFPGTIFLLSAGVIIIGFIIVLATYFSTTVKFKRKSKEFTDTLLNDYR